MSEHYYLATACLHGLHPQCRSTCKFCGSGCICPCHHRTTVAHLPGKPVHDIVREHLNAAVNARAA